MSTITKRRVRSIAAEIEADWPKISPNARPHLDLLHKLDDVHDTAANGQSGRAVVSFFLANASTYKGVKAQELKAELRTMV